MKEYFTDRSECVLCKGPLFKISQQISQGAPSGVLFHFEGLHSAQHCLDALHRFQNENILLAFDSDNFADFVCWQISSYLSQIGGRTGAVKRVTVQAFDKENMIQALDSARGLDTMGGISFYSRQVFDNCLARHLTKLIGTDHGPGNLPLQKNSLTALFLLAEREQERSQALLTPHWQIQATLPAATQGQSMTVLLGKGSSDLASSTLPIDETKAHALRDRLTQTPYKVTSKGHAPLTIPAPEPYQVPELLHDAMRLLGLTPIQTIGIVKKLFHGVAITGQIHGLISTPHPGKEPLSQKIITTLHQQVATRYGAEAVNTCKTPTLGMIIPLRPELSDTDINASLTTDEAALYDLIRRRALASQMRPAIGSTTTINFQAADTAFHAHLHEVTDPGFLQTTPAKISALQTLINGAEIAAGQEFMPIEVTCTPLVQDTEESAPYTIKTLLADLSDFSIAPDLATISMLNLLITEGYASLSAEGNLIAAENTSRVVNILDRAFPRMQRVNLAAYIEQTINEATSARKDLPFALTQFDQTLSLHGQILIKAKTSTKVQPRARTSSTIIKQAAPVRDTSSPSPPEKNDELTNNDTPPAEAEQDTLAQTPVLPEAELSQISIPSELAPEEAPLAKEVAASVLPNEAPPGSETQAEDEQQTDIFANNDLQQAFAEALSETTNPPDRTTAEPPPTTGVTSTPNDNITCPLCGHEVTPRQTPTGKTFYACRHENCQFMSWSPPHNYPCGLCDSPYLIEKTVHGITLLRCPQAGCTYEQPLSKDNLPTSPTASATKKKLVRRVASSSTATTSTKKVRIVRRRA